MKAHLTDLNAFVAVARAGGYRDGGRASGMSASAPSAAVRRLEAHLSVRLLNRTTRSVVPSDSGAPARAIRPGVKRGRTGARRGREPARQRRRHAAPQTCRSAWREWCRLRSCQRSCRLSRHPVGSVTDESFVDVIAVWCDAGIRYGERLEQDMIAVPIGPRVQRFACAAAPAYRQQHGRPKHPGDLLRHACIRGRFPIGAMATWTFERNGETLRVDPTGTLLVLLGGTTDLAVDAACAATGVIYLFEEWLRPHLASGALEPLLQPWWPKFEGPFLYYPGRRLVPTPLRAFIKFIKRPAPKPVRS